MADQQLTPPQQEDASTETHAEPDATRHGDASHGGASSAAGHDDHGHASEALGPVDRAAWGAGLLGVLLGLVVVVAIALASGAIG